MSSRYLYSVALKNKTDTEVLNGFKKIYDKSKIKAVRSDNGSEFINKKFTDYLDKNGIKQILSEASKPQSNGMIKRANATIKELIQKSLEINEKFDWSITRNIPLQDLHRMIKSYDKIILDTAYDKELKKKKSNISREVFEKGDLVRLYTPSDKTRQVWSNEVYEIAIVYKPKKNRKSHIVYMSIKWKGFQTYLKKKNY